MKKRKKYEWRKTQEMQNWRQRDKEEKQQQINKDKPSIKQDTKEQQTTKTKQQN